MNKKNTTTMKTWIGILASVIFLCFGVAGQSYSKEVRKPFSLPSIHIDAMEGTLEFINTRARGRVLITITDNSGEPVADVQVKGEWGGLVSGRSFGITGDDGTVSFVSKSTVESGIITFQVSNVGVYGYKYDPSQNKVDKVQISTDVDTNLAPEAIISVVLINGIPPVNINTPVIEVVAPVNITMGGAKSYDQDGSIVKYNWNLNDGNYNDGTYKEDSSIDLSYQEPGEYKVILTVTDDQGKEASAETIINVIDPGELM